MKTFGIGIGIGIVLPAFDTDPDIDSNPDIDGYRSVVGAAVGCCKIGRRAAFAWESPADDLTGCISGIDWLRRQERCDVD